MNNNKENNDNKVFKLYEKLEGMNDNIELNEATNKAITQLESFNNNILTKEYKLAIKLLVFDILYYNKRDKILAVPMPTGSGKSTITELTLAYMYNNKKLKKNCGTIILKLTINDCNITANNINNYAGKKIAYAYHSGEYNGHKSKFIKSNELLEYPILILTHEGFKAYNDNIMNSTPKNEEKLTLWTDKKVDKIKVNYNAFMRERLIIDEEISNVEPINITMDKINNLENAIMNMGNNILFDKFNEFIINIKKQFIKSYSEKANKLHFAYFENINIPEGLDEAIFNIKDIKVKDSYLDILNLITHGGYVKYAENIENKTITTYKYIDIFNPLFNKIQLDATANVNILYRNNENYYIQNIPEFKTYTNTYLHIYDKITGSRSSLVENNEKGLLQAFINDIDNKVPLNEKALIIFNDNKLEEPFNSIVENMELIKRINTTHYGRTTGANTWKDYDKVFIIGINIYSDPTYPIFYYCNSNDDNFNSIDTSMIPIKGARVYSEKKFEQVRISIVASKVIQALNRIKIRKYVDGDTPETHMYIINSDKSIDNLIATSMKGINMSYDWDLDYEPEKLYLKENKVLNNTQKIIDCIKFIVENKNKQSNSVINQYKESKLLTDKGINKKLLRECLEFKTRDTFNKAINEPIFQQFCIDYNINISNSKSRYIKIN